MNLAKFLTRFGKIMQVSQELTRYVEYESCQVSYKIWQDHAR